MYVKRNPKYALKAIKMTEELKRLLKDIKDNYLKIRHIFDSTLNAAYVGITESNVCEYIETVKKSTPDFMYLPRDECITIGKGWGKEVL